MKELLAEGDFVRLLARELIGKADGADDLVQDAWMTALARRPVAVRKPRSWLARVVRRLAANLRRSDRRRQRREQDVARALPTEAPSTAEIVAREQARQRVVAAVLALEEPFRTTVLARFYECLDDRELAARESIAVATVRSRLKRGLDRLRARLDAEHGGRREAWTVPLAPLAARAPASAVAVSTLGALMSTSKKAVLAAAVILVAGLSLWSVLSPAPDLDSPPAPTTARSSALRGDAGPSDPRSEDARREAVDPAGTQLSTPAGVHVPYPIVDEPPVEVPVRVLDVETRMPVAGAEVVYLPFRVDMLRAEARGDRELHEIVSSEVFLERFGARTRTGPHGQATVRLPRSGASVSATLGDRWVRDRITPADLLPGECAILWLEDPRWIRIRLVDESASRKPVAGALIEVRSSGTGPVVLQSAGYGAMAGPSDAEGMILFPWRRDQESIRVRPWTTGPRKWRPLELPDALDRVTELRYPPTGSLTVELRTPAGHLWPGPLNVYVYGASGARLNPDVGPVPWFSEPGIYRVPHVELGQSLRVSAYPQHAAGPHGFGWGSSVLVAGPTEPGEDLSVVLRTETEPCILRATLRDASGSAPPSGLMATINLENGDRRDTCAYMPLGVDGLVGWAVSPGPPPKGRIQLRESNKRVIECTWELDADATPGVHDLGTLIVEGPPVVVAGEVEIGTRPWRGPPLQIEVDMPGGQGGWKRLEEIGVFPDTDPNFAVRKSTEAERVRVTVRGGRHVLPPEPVVVDVGVRDLRLQVDRGHALRARVLAPAAFARAVICRAVREDGAELPAVAKEWWSDEEPRRSDATLADFDGAGTEFLWPSLPAGSYRVEVHAPGMRQPLATVPAVLLGPGSEPDPRLDPIDARETTRTLTVRVDPIPSGPRPITDGGVLAFPSGRRGPTLHGLLFDARGEARLTVDPDPVDLIVAVPGFRLWQASSVSDTSVRVELEPCLGVPFRLAEDLAERFAGYRIEVRLEPKEAEGTERVDVQLRRPGEQDPTVHTSLTWLRRLVDGGTGTIEHGRCTVPVSAPGRFEVNLVVRGPTRTVWVNESLTHWRYNPVEPSVITVSGDDDPPVVIDVPDDIVDKVLDRLSR